jgi:hypothetical protein
MHKIWNSYYLTILIKVIFYGAQFISTSKISPFNHGYYFRHTIIVHQKRGVLRRYLKNFVHIISKITKIFP